MEQPQELHSFTLSRHIESDYRDGINSYPVPNDLESKSNRVQDEVRNGGT